MKQLVIYNVDTGDIISTLFVYDENVRYNGGTIINVPDNKVLERMDVSKTPPTPVYATIPVDPVPTQIDDIQLALIELDERIAALEV